MNRTSLTPDKGRSDAARDLEDAMEAVGVKPHDLAAYLLISEKMVFNLRKGIAALTLGRVHQLPPRLRDEENAQLARPRFAPPVRATDTSPRAGLRHVEPEESEPDALAAHDDDLDTVGLHPAFEERASRVTRREPAPIVPAPRYDEVFVEGTAWLDAQAEAPLPVAWEPPVVEAPRCGTTHHHDCDCQRDARGEPRREVRPATPAGPREIAEAAIAWTAHVNAVADPSAPELERVRALLADETAARVAAERERDQLAAALRRQSGRAQQPRVVQVVRTVRVAAANPVTALVEHLARRAR